MRVLFETWSHSVVLVPWHEASAEPAASPVELSQVELRQLIASEPGLARSLRELLGEFGGVLARELLDEDELARQIVRSIERGALRVEAEAHEPILSDVFEVYALLDYHEFAPSEIVETETHWIEIELLDERGEPVVHEPCEIILPDGREHHRRTDHNGLIRVDRTIAGICEVSFPELEASALVRAPLASPPPPRPEPSHWVEVELVDEDGRPIADEPCEITLPSGECITRVTDAEGVIRVANIDAGTCEVRFPEREAEAVVRAPLAEDAHSSSVPFDPSHWVEVELIDEDGRAIVDEPCEITLPGGERIERMTDARGLIRVSGIDVGLCEVRFPERDAVTLSTAGAM